MPQLRAGPLVLAGSILLVGFGAVRAADAPPRPSGYLAAEIRQVGVVLLPPPPSKASARGKADEAIFRKTRALKDGPRWKLAQSDADADVPSGLHAFDCALGVTYDPVKAPGLTRLMMRVRIDAGALVNTAKDHYARPRPLVGNSLAICLDRKTFAGQPSYPSGHSTAGWSWALILAELAPDREGAVLARGRAYGESRVVCGAHYLSDIEAGRSAAAAVVAALHANAEFKSDMDAARVELAAMRASGEAPKRDCIAEAKLISQPID